MCKQTGEPGNSSTSQILEYSTSIEFQSPPCSRLRSKDHPTLNRFHVMAPVTPPWGMPSRPRPRARVSMRSIPKHSSTAFLHDNYDILHLLGKGSFANVHLVREHATDLEKVCKVVSTSGLSSEDLEQAKEEVNILRRLEHPGIVQIHEYGYDKEVGRLIVVLEYLSGGSCRTLLKKQGPLKESFVANVALQVSDAIAYCHSRGVVHRDVKPEHIMLVGQLQNGFSTCKLIDFGLSFLCSGTRHAHGCSELSKRVGTPAYMAPEVVNKSMSCTSKADVWSLGVSVLELLLGKNPFSRDDRHLIFKAIKRFWDLDALIASSDELKAWRALKAETRAFISSLLKVDPGDRFSAAQTLNILGEMHSQDRPNISLPDVAGTSQNGLGNACCLKQQGLSRACADKSSIELIPDVFLRMPNSARLPQLSQDCLLTSARSLGEETASRWSLPLFARRRPSNFD